MGDFVLVHGAWHGWRWSRVRPLLEEQGHRVWTPTLTGNGDRAHLATPEVDLESHISDLAAVLEENDLAGVILVAHSYAGVPVTVLADRFASGSPRSSISTRNAARRTEHVRHRLRQAKARRANAHRGPEKWLAPVPDGETFGISDDDDLEWVRARLTPQPRRTFQDPVHLRSEPPHVPSAAIICTIDGVADATALVSFSGMPTQLVEAAHDMMITEPQLLCDVIRSLLDRLKGGASRV